MSEGGKTTNNSVVSLGDLSKPAAMLIEKISDAIGGVARPWQIRRVARADADAATIQAEAQAKAGLIHAKSRLEISEVERRGLERIVIEQGKNQENIERISAKAISHIKDDAKPENIEDDWIRYFFERSKLVSDEDMQQIWANILAGETNSPKSFSRKTIDLISTLDKDDANAFTKFCSFVWLFNELTPIIIDFQHDIYNKSGIKFSVLSHLHYLGLINFDPVGFMQKGVPDRFIVHYYGITVQLTRPEGKENFALGKALFTKAGAELAVISGSQSSEEYLDYAIKEWAPWNATILSFPPAGDAPA
ncbi:MAG: hypothetical protein RLZZ187_330 [Pseudomonadota bacterium]|jgi:hypothetical protein